MMMRAALFCLLLATLASSKFVTKRVFNNLHLKGCIPDSQQYVKIQNVQVSPMPIVVPGKLSVGGKVSTTAVPAGSNVKIQLKVTKINLGVKWDLPCLKLGDFQVGSCVYDNACSMVGSLVPIVKSALKKKFGTDCPAFLTQAGIPCNINGCPIPAMNVNLATRTFELKKENIPSVVNFGLPGDYEAHVEAFINGKKVLCYDAGFTIAEKKECSGWLCN